jgi:branched-subunit amino acid aminotransferase/4-amino-4-deoxychorismate lyase
MLAYVNGSFVKDEDAKVSVRDRGFMLGDAVFEVWRTYGGRPCQPMVEKNLARLSRSLRYMELNPETIVPAVRSASTTLIEKNAAEITKAGDVHVVTIVSRGFFGFVDEIDGGSGKPTVTVFLNPVPYRGQGSEDLYGKGARLVTSLLYREPWGAVDPRIKTTSRFAYVRAERKMGRAGPRTWILFCDNEGNPTECSGANILLVNDGAIERPPRERVLGGINMDTFLELAAKIGVSAEERKLALYDYLNADEVILTTTSIGAVRVTEIDGIKLTPRGDVYDRVMREWFKYVDLDFVASAREQAGVKAT